MGDQFRSPRQAERVVRSPSNAVLSSIIPAVRNIAAYIPESVKGLGRKALGTEPSSAAAHGGPAVIREKDAISWHRFQIVDIRGKLCSFLVIGYEKGIQVWDVTQPSAAMEIISRREGAVRCFEILPHPSTASAPVAHEDDRPLAAVVFSVAGARNQIRFLSLRSLSYVQVLDVGSEIHSISVTDKAIAVAASESVVLYDTMTLQRIAAYPACAAPASHTALALSSRLVAFAAADEPSASRQDLTPPPGGWGAYAVDTARTLASDAAQRITQGLSYLGEMGRRHLSNYLAGGSPPSQFSYQPTQPGVVPLSTSPSALPTASAAIPIAARPSNIPQAASSSPSGFGTPPLLGSTPPSTVLNVTYGVGEPGVGSAGSAGLYGSPLDGHGAASAAAAAGAVVSETDFQGVQGVVAIRDLQSQRSGYFAHFRAFTRAVGLLRFDPSGTLLFCSDAGGRAMHVYRIMPGGVRRLYAFNRGLSDAPIIDAAFSNDGRWLVAVSAHGTAHLYGTMPCGGPVTLSSITAPLAPHPYCVAEEMSSTSAYARIHTGTDLTVQPAFACMFLNKYDHGSLATLAIASPQGLLSYYQIVAYPASQLGTVDAGTEPKFVVEPRLESEYDVCRRAAWPTLDGGVAFQVPSIVREDDQSRQTRWATQAETASHPAPLPPLWRRPQIIIKPGDVTASMVLASEPQPATYGAKTPLFSARLPMEEVQSGPELRKDISTALLTPMSRQSQ